MFRIATIATAIALTAGAAFAGQSKTIPGDAITVTARVEAVEAQSRTLTLKKTDGTYVTFVVPMAYERFPAIKVGDTITARYYDTVTFRKQMPGEKAVDTAADAITKSPGAKPGATAATQRTVTTTITAIDMKIPSITFTGPNNWVYSSKVQDPAALKTVKVGDKVDIVWTEALSISVVAPK